MPRPRGIIAGGDFAGVRVEYVKSRRKLRLSGWHGDDAIDPLELTLEEFCSRLNIKVDDMVSSTQCLILAGSSGSRDLAVTFSSEAEARQEFSEIRLGRTPGASYAWGELLSLLPTGKLKQMCWFGLDRPAGRAPRIDGLDDGGAPAQATVAIGRRLWGSTSRKRKRSR